jgi:hypothetical protein
LHVDGDGRFLTHPPFERGDEGQLFVGGDGEKVGLGLAE